MALQAAQPRAFSRLLGVGGYRPSRVVSNDEMCTMVESTPEWIEQRTGIVERRWATEDETLQVMALAAARRALDYARVGARQIDVVILATVSVYRQTPALAPQLATELGCAGPAAWDVGGGCAGFCLAVGQADALVRAGVANHVLVIGADRLSDFLDVTDRGTAFLLGDGAGAVVVGPSTEPGISPTVWGSDGSQADAIEVPFTWQQAMQSGEWPNLAMNGRAVFRWATTFIADRAAEVLARSGLTPDELDVFLPHQANNRIIDSMLRHLELGERTVVARDIRHLGNTSAASIPLAMERMLETGAAHPDQTALLIGFGAGLAYAGQVVLLP